jgi:anti-anti-sigma factor
MLSVSVQTASSDVVLSCRGRIVLGVEAETLRCIAMARPERRVVLDLQDVDEMDAAGLGLLVELHCRARQRAAELRIANASPRVRRLMALTSLDSVLEIEGLRMESGVEGERRAMTA